MAVNAYRASIFHCLDDSADNNYEYYPDGILLVEDGLIKAVGHAEQIQSQFASDIKVTEYKNSLITPGFIDTHVHYPQVDVIASYGERLLDWLEKYTFPAEAKFSDAEYATEIAEFFLQQLFQNGTTSALVFPTVHPESVNAIFTAAEKYQIRLISGKVLSDRNAHDAMLDKPEVAYQQCKELIEQWHGKGRLSYAVTPRFAVTCSEDMLQVAQRLLQEYPDVYLQTHLAETRAEVEFVLEAFPQANSYLEVYDQFDLVTPKSVFAHCIHMHDKEFTRLAEAGSAISFCPTSNLFLGSGLFNYEMASQHQVNLSMGTDVGAGTSFSMLQTLNEAYKVAQLRHQNLSPVKAFYLATLGGAKALSLDSSLGNLAAGKEADFIVMDLAATPIMKHRMAPAKSIEETLFILMTLGDDRAIVETFVLGNSVYRK